MVMEPKAQVLQFSTRALSPLPLNARPRCSVAAFAAIRIHEIRPWEYGRVLLFGGPLTHSCTSYICATTQILHRDLDGNRGLRPLLFSHDRRGKKGQEGGGIHKTSR